MARTRKRKAQLATLLDPQYVSVVKSPSNQIGFKVVRSEEDDNKQEGKMVTVKTTRTRKKRSDSSLLSIDLPPSVVTEEMAYEAMEVFGMEDDYEVVQRGDSFSLVRKGADESAVTVPVGLGEGIVANVLASSFESNKAQRSDRGGVHLVRLDFDSAIFPDEDSVEEWLGDNAIDFKSDGITVSDNGVSVVRHDSYDEEDSKTIEIAEGVTGVIVRSDEDNIPALIKRSVVEEAYGSWGWGQLDFSAAMADPEFTEKSWDAIYMLRDVLENIVFYSYLKLEERKALIVNACEQYANYMAGLIDALPREVILAARSTIETDEQETSTMATKKTTTKKTTKRSSTAFTPEQQEEMIGFIGDAVAQAMPEAMSVIESKLIERSSEDDDSEVTLGTIANTLKEMGENQKQMRADLDKLNAELDGATFSRSDDEDEEEEEEEDDDAGTQRKRGDSPFTGMFDTALDKA